ncbi:DNA polymeraseeta subunit [Rhodotorula toruloides]|uniref:DNA polymerase eta n=1 Tax=Rhodotorula toruloides TaxID=5286 RepID=A0A511KKM7_RHOTO|nr:DNA polymeraseeta subunit [Rhodotorula toruloides]
MGSPPVPDRSPTKRAVSPSSRPPAFRARSPPRPHPGTRPPVAPASVPFSPPKRKTGGSIEGKERATSEGVEGLGGDGEFPPAPVPTYRHLLGSNNGGAANPLRVIAHIDIDAAYAAMEMSRLGIPEDQPMAVQQWNGLIAVNYPARAYGITRHETPAEALKKCPDLKLVHVQTYKNGEKEPGYWDGAKPETHKVSLDMYRKESRKILAVFSEFCPIVEKASIDESFLDLTLPVRQLLLDRYPALSSAASGNLDEPLPSPSELGVQDGNIKWDELCNLIPFLGQKKEKVRRLNPDGTAAPPSSSPTKAAATSDGAAASASGAAADDGSPTPEPPEPPFTWSDICLSLGASIVRDVRAAVKERLGYTCSAGIATNKMLAKLTSAWKKPNAQTVLRHCAVPAFLRPMPFQKIRNLGGKLGTAVQEAYQANTVGDLLKFSLAELKAKLGDSSGMWLWEIVRGLDYTEVDTKTQVKSMLSSKNFRPSIKTYGETIHWLNILSTELHLRLTEAREDSPGLWPKTITFTHRSPTFVIRSHQIPFPFTSNLTISYILRHAEKLFRAAIGSHTSTGPPPTSETPIGPYSNIQLSFSGLERLEDGQRGIEGFFAAQTTNGASAQAAAEKEKKRKEQEVGGEKSEWADEEDKPAKKRKVGKTENANADATKVKSRSPSITVQPDGTEQLTLSSDSEGDAGPPSPRPLPTAKCDECGKKLVIPVDARAALANGGWKEFEVKAALEKERTEHADFHVAKAILEKERKANGWLLGGPTSGAKSASSASTNGNSEKRGKKGFEPSKKEKKREKGTLTGFFGRKG